MRSLPGGSGVTELKAAAPFCTCQTGQGRKALVSRAGKDVEQGGHPRGRESRPGKAAWHELRRPVRGRLRWGQTCTRARPEETRLGIRTGISEVKGNAI